MITSFKMLVDINYCIDWYLNFYILFTDPISYAFRSYLIFLLKYVQCISMYNMNYTRGLSFVGSGRELFN